MQVHLDLARPANSTQRKVIRLLIDKFWEVGCYDCLGFKVGERRPGSLELSVIKGEVGTAIEFLPSFVKQVDGKMATRIEAYISRVFERKQVA